MRKRETKMEKIKGDRITAAAAAREIGCDVEFLRRQMQRKDGGRWDLGEVVPPEVPGGNSQYFIFRGKLDKFLGRREGKTEWKYETYSVIRCQNTGFVFRVGDTVSIEKRSGEQFTGCMIAAVNAEGFMFKKGKESGIVQYAEIAEIKHCLDGKEATEGVI